MLPYLAARPRFLHGPHREESVESANRSHSQRGCWRANQMLEVEMHLYKESVLMEMEGVAGCGEES